MSRRTSARNRAPSGAAPRLLPSLLRRVGLALVVASLVGRTFTTGAGLELHAPGAQLLFDALTLSAVAAVGLARFLAGGVPFLAAGLAPLLASCLAAGLGFALAARAPNADLAWRTALGWTASLGLLLALRDLASDGATARRLAALVVACVACGAALALYEARVELPALEAALASGALDTELAVHGRGFAIAARERLSSPAAAGPYLLPALLAAVALAAAPLCALALRRALRANTAAVGLRCLSALGCAVALLALVGALPSTHSKGAAVTALGVLALLALTAPSLVPWRRRLAAALLAGGALVGLTGLVAWQIAPERAGVGLSLQVRLEYWRAGLGMALDHPLLGVGPAGFRELYSVYKPARAEETLHAHNALVEVLAEGGLLGLTAVLGVVWAWGRAALRPLLRPLRPGPLGSPAPLGGDAWALLSGHFLGLLLLAGHGDRYNAAPETRGQLVFVACALPAAWAAVSAGLALGRRGSNAWAAAVAGASALAWDGLLDFGLHQSGVLTVCCSLGVLAPTLCGQPPARAAGPAARRFALAALAAVSLLGLGLTLRVVPPALRADAARDAARDAHGLGVDLLRRGRRDEAIAALREATAGYRRALELAPGEVRTWLELATALDALARAVPAEAKSLREEGVAAARRATRLDPWAADAWNELGRQLAARPEPDPAALAEAARAFDEATVRYPSHPGYRLEAGLAWRRTFARLPRGHPLRAEARRRAREQLLAARDASETARLVRLRLTPEQLRAAKEALRALGKGAGARDP